MDGLTFPSPGYQAVAVQPVEPAAAPATSVSPAPTSTVTPAPATAASTSNSAGPAFVPDFSSGIAGGYVLDFRDPTTHTVLVQVPMRTALAQFAEINDTRKVGKTVDTAA